MKKQKRSPIIASWLLNRILQPREFDTARADFEEQYLYHVEKYGKIAAWYLYWLHLSASLFSFIKHNAIGSLSMLKNYVKIALRNIYRHKTYSFINISGLAMGIACFLLIMLYVRYELSYDKFHEKADRIYRVAWEVIRPNGAVLAGANASDPLGPIMLDYFPEIVDQVRLKATSFNLKYEDKSFNDDRIFLTDPNVFDMFNFELLAGNSADVLRAPNNVVLSESTARKYFGSQDAMGKSLEVLGAAGRSLIVTGIMRDIPKNSQFGIDMFVPLMQSDIFDTWNGHDGTWTYVELSENADPKEIESKMPQFFLDKHPRYNKQNTYMQYLEPLPDIHLRSQFGGQIHATSSITYVYLFSAIAGFILLLACINFMNLSTSKSIIRAKEIGMRKVIGAQRKQLVTQFLGESFIMTLISFFLGLFLVWMSLPVFNAFVSRELSLDVFRNLDMVMGFLGTVIFVGFAAGSFPALFLSKMQSLSAIRGKFSSSSSGALIRKILVVFQFSISAAMVTATVIVYNQLEYIRTKDLGFNKDSIVVLNGTSTNKSLMEELKSLNAVVNITESSEVPSNPANNWLAQMGLPGDPNPIEGVLNIAIDEDYFDTFGIQFVQGRNFSKDLPSDKGAYIINETAAAQLKIMMGNQEVLDKMILANQYEGPVIGIVKDFNYYSLHIPTPPMLLYLKQQDRQGWETWGTERVSLRINAQNIETVLPQLETTWKKFNPNGIYNYFFVDESHANLHRSDTQLGNIFRTFSVLSIVIACLGLFGLSAFTTGRRIKEIGIRKVLGARISTITFLVLKQFIGFILLSFIIASPIVYKLAEQWLINSYAYHIEIGASTFVFSGLIIALVTLITVSFHSLKAGLLNPVDSLRNE